MLWIKFEKIQGQTVVPSFIASKQILASPSTMKFCKTIDKSSFSRYVKWKFKNFEQYLEKSHHLINDIRKKNTSFEA